MSYERFTASTKKVIDLANDEAQRLGHGCVGTEHILVGIIQEGNGVAAEALDNLTISLEDVQDEVGKVTPCGPVVTKKGTDLPVSRAAKVAIIAALDESLRLHDAHIGTEHILLGIVGNKHDVASTVLMNLGHKLDEVRDETLFLIAQGPETAAERKSRKASQRKKHDAA